MTDTQKQALMSAFRSLLIVLGSLLVAHGAVNETQWSEIMGALTIIAPIVWGVVDKFLAEKNTQARVAEAYNAGASQLPPPNKEVTP